MKNDTAKTIDMKLTLKALLAWWSVIFVILVLLFFPTLHLDLLIKIILAAVIAVPLAPVLVYVIFPLFNKQFHTYKNVLLTLNNEGYSARVMDELEKQLDWCKQQSGVYATYRNSYALSLANGCASLYEFERAQKFLCEVELQELFSNAETPSAQQNIAMYYNLKVQITAALGDRESAESALQEMERLFAGLGTESLLINYSLDSARYEIHYLNERYEECEACMEKYKECEELKFNTCILLGKCYYRMGRTDEAEALFASLEPMIRNDWMRRMIELDKQNAMLT